MLWRNYAACSPFRATERRYFRQPSGVPLPGVEEHERHRNPGAELSGKKRDKIETRTSAKYVLIS